ncbi:hypothetical protein [Ramlibacter montanisoli]|uniref:Uncharacterized protein n=1 Tax=Ramlibacter montanisoli TaxID=2732512 RepID=A0A849KJR8_9BURK|nr:hypothetical protein [Ramlibacter montanisoli]NNU44761.1 hypothetical protein [Ramlibacter montanisoli]
MAPASSRCDHGSGACSSPLASALASIIRPTRPSQMPAGKASMTKKENFAWRARWKKPIPRPAHTMAHAGGWTK